MLSNILKIVFFLLLSIIILTPKNHFIEFTSEDYLYPKHEFKTTKNLNSKKINISNSIINSSKNQIITQRELKYSYQKKTFGEVKTIKANKAKNIYFNKSGEVNKTKNIQYLHNNKNKVFNNNYNTGRFLRIYFDNDIFNNTDYYFTNGIKFEFIDPVLSYSPIMRFLLPSAANSTNYYGISLVQNMYTPTNPDLGNIVINVRPFAAYLYLGHFKISNDKYNKIRFTSEIDIGVIGPGSLGGYFQHAIHEHEPLGWQHQVKNDILINYKLEVEKAFINSRYFEFNGMSNAFLGTVYTNASIGFHIRFGKISPYFEKLDIASFSREEKSGDKFRYYFFIKGQTNFIAYDATLQGGATNRNSIYTINAEMMKRTVWQASAGFVLAYNTFNFEYEQFFRSPEFSTARPFLWGSIKTSFSL